MKATLLLLSFVFITNISISAQCGAGKYLNNASCDSCEAGYYCPGDSNRYKCALDSGCISCDKVKGYCTSCPAGKQIDSVGCEPCKAGTFKKHAGNGECIACAPGSYQGMTGKDTCYLCATGTFQPMPESKDCYFCPPGTHTSVTGSVSCSKCPPGTFNMNMGLDTCFNCPEGTYQPDSASLRCNNCPEKHTSKEASDSISDCYLIVSEVNAYTKESIEFAYNRCNKILVLHNKTTFDIFQVKVFSLSGKLVYEGKLVNKQLFLNLSEMKNGVYIFEVTNAKNRYVKTIPVY